MTAARTAELRERESAEHERERETEESREGRAVVIRKRSRASGRATAEDERKIRRAGRGMAPPVIKGGAWTPCGRDKRSRNDPVGPWEIYFTPPKGQPEGGQMEEGGKG